MKKITTYIFAILLVVGAAVNASAQSEESRQVSGFSSVASGGPFDVDIKIDGTESLKISASPEVMKQIETTVDNGKLHIKFKNHEYWDHHDDYGPIHIYITAKSLSGLANAGSGTMKVEGVVSGERVNISLAGSGTIISSVKSGEFHAAISGSGSLTINGSADEAKVSIAGSGELNGKDLKTNTASVSIAGSGTAYLAADKTISAKIIGSGNVIYSGNATSDCTKIGSGRLSKAD